MKSQAFKGHKSFAMQKSYRVYQNCLDRRLSRPKTANLQGRYKKVQPKFSKSSKAYGARD